jgi:hypothetical protein
MAENCAIVKSIAIAIRFIIFRQALLIIVINPIGHGAIGERHFARIVSFIPF